MLYSKYSQSSTGASEKGICFHFRRFVPTTRDGHSVYFREKSTRKYLAVDKDGKVILQESDHVTDEYAWYLPPEFTEERLATC